MRTIPLKLSKSLQFRKENNSYRKLTQKGERTDFSSNDYLGFSRNPEIFEQAYRILKAHSLLTNGATGSRLLSGNHYLFELAEQMAADYFEAESSLIYNSGYDANTGFFSAVPQRGDLVLYDEHVHASIRDGLQLGRARSFRFAHNDLNDLERRLQRLKKEEMAGEVYVVTESVFSMDGDSPDLKRLLQLSQVYDFRLVIDEAHAVGVLGDGKGLVPGLDTSSRVFARIVTFGKAFGSHGAAILGSEDLREYLINFSRSLIYTTALPPHAVATLMAAMEYIQEKGGAAISALHQQVRYFLDEVDRNDLGNYFLKSNSAIHSCLIPGNDLVRKVSQKLGDCGFDVKPILNPTVPEGSERLRFCMHNYNSKQELGEVVSILAGELKR